MVETVVAEQVPLWHWAVIYIWSMEYFLDGHRSLA